MGPAPGKITHLLHEASTGNDSARAALLEVVYEELRRLAARRMKGERFDHTLQPTALVHEAYLCLFDGPQRSWTNRTHFFAFSARVMRNILVDHARRHNTQREGGTNTRLALDPLLSSYSPPVNDVVVLDQALERLAVMDPRQAQIVELRFFAGMTEEEIAEILGLSLRTVKREWIAAKAWLYQQLA